MNKLLAGLLTALLVFPVSLFAEGATTKHVFSPDGTLVATLEATSTSASSGNTGFKTAGTINESTGFSNFTTTALGTSNNSYATSLTTNPLGRISTFSFSIPGGATINGIEVTLEAKVAFGTVAIPFSLSWNNGTNFTATKSNTITTTEQVFTYGGSSDTWGRTWTTSELADSTIQVKIDPPGSAFTISYDHIQVKVHYTTQGGAATSTTRFIHPDHLGGTNVTTNASSTVIEVTDYYPYGDQRINTTSATQEQRKFTGHEYDSESDLTYAKQRYYEQDIGRFISVDPAFLAIGDSKKLVAIIDRAAKGQKSSPSIADTLDEKAKLQDSLSNPQQLNSYSYAGNNPINLTDPNGELYPLILAIYSAASFIVSAYDLSITLEHAEQFSEEQINQSSRNFFYNAFLTALGPLKFLGLPITAKELLGIETGSALIDAVDTYFGQPESPAASNQEENNSGAEPASTEKEQ